MSYNTTLRHVLLLFTLLTALSFCIAFAESHNTDNPVVPRDSKRAKEIIGEDGAKMALIPAGKFQMGSTDGSDDERPLHTVYLDAFYMDVHEVTNAQYKRFVDATGHNAPIFWKGPDFGAPNQPVVGVSWEDAGAYARWAGKRLPTEAEWERAARGGLVVKKHVWGDTWPPPKGAGNFADETAKTTFPDWSVISGYDDGYTYPAPVGSFAPNKYGLYDMGGNVSEWCVDWYDERYYADSPEHNPRGPSSGEGRVLRGGSWLNFLILDGLRVADRYHLSSAPYPNVGFRCVMDVPKNALGQ